MNRIQKELLSDFIFYIEEFPNEELIKKTLEIVESSEFEINDLKNFIKTLNLNLVDERNLSRICKILIKRFEDL